MKTNIRYKGNTNNTSVIIFLKSKVKNSQRCYFAWENLRGGLCCCCIFISFSFHFCVFKILKIGYSICIFIVCLLMFFIHIYFPASCLTLPWTIAGFLHPFYIFSPAHRKVICDTFISTFPGSSYREHYGFEWAFFTHRRFLPYAPSQTFLTQPAFMKAFPRS